MNAPLARVGDLAEQIRGVTYAKGDASLEPRDGYVPILRAGNISDEGLTLTDLVFVPKARVSERQLLRKNDVLVAASSGSLDVVGKAALVDSDLQAGFGAFCKVLRPSQQVHPAYFAHFFKTPAYRSRVSALAAGANINNLRNEDLDDLALPLPSAEGQRRIADILDQADALRAKRRAALAQVDGLTQAIFLEMFGDPATNPHSWPIRRAGDVSDVQGGLQVSASRRSAAREVPYLRVANVYRGRLDLTEIKAIRASESEIARTALRANDLLLVEGHGNPEEIGRCALWDGSIPECVHQNHLIRARFAADVIEPRFACEHINSPAGRRHLLRSGKTTSGLNTISVSEVRSVPIAVPPMHLQRSFARRATTVDRLKAAHRASLAQLDALFASLQHRAFRGEL